MSPSSTMISKLLRSAPRTRRERLSPRIHSEGELSRTNADSSAIRSIRTPPWAAPRIMTDTARIAPSSPGMALISRSIDSGSASDTRSASSRSPLSTGVNSPENSRHACSEAAGCGLSSTRHRQRMNALRTPTPPFDAAVTQGPPLSFPLSIFDEGPGADRPCDRRNALDRSLPGSARREFRNIIPRTLATADSKGGLRLTFSCASGSIVGKFGLKGREPWASQGLYGPLRPSRHFSA